MVQDPRMPKDNSRRLLRAEIAARLKAEIARTGISQNALARMLKVSSGTVSGWVTGRTQPPLEDFALICHSLRLEPNKILRVTTDVDTRPVAEQIRDELAGSALALAMFDEIAKRERLSDAELRMRGMLGETMGEVEKLAARAVGKQDQPKK